MDDKVDNVLCDINNSDYKKNIEYIEYIELLNSNKFEEAIDLVNIRLETSKDKCKYAANFIHDFFEMYQIYIGNLGLLVHPKLNIWLMKDGIQKSLDILKTRYNIILKTNLEENDILVINSLADLCYILREYTFCLNTYSFLYNFYKTDRIKLSIINCLIFLDKYEEVLKYDQYNNTAYSFIHSSSEKAFYSVYKHILETSVKNDIIPFFSPLPNSILYQDNEITFTTINKGCFAGHNPCIFKDKGLYIGNRITLSPLKSNLSYLYRNITSNINQAMVVYATNPSNYYHFWLEYIAKLYTIHCIKDDKIKNILNKTPLYICTEEKYRDNIKEAFHLLNIKQTFKIISSNKIIETKKLYILDVTTISNYTDKVPASIWNKYLPDKESAIRLREKLFKKPVNNNTFIYLSRRGRNPRSIVDDSNLTNMLSIWAKKHNLDFNDSQSNLTLQEQIDLYSKAKVIFGLHGAGFTNILFIPKNCLVCEIPVFNNCNNMFLELSSLFGIKHVYPPNLKCSYYNHIDSLNQESIEEMKQFLDDNYSF